MAKDCDALQAGKGGSPVKPAGGKSKGKGKSKGRGKGKSPEGTPTKNQDAAVKSHQVVEPSTTAAALLSTPTASSTVAAATSSALASMGGVVDEMSNMVKKLNAATRNEGLSSPQATTTRGDDNPT